MVRLAAACGVADRNKQGHIKGSVATSCQTPVCSGPGFVLLPHDILARRPERVTASDRLSAGALIAGYCDARVIPRVSCRCLGNRKDDRKFPLFAYKLIFAYSFPSPNSAIPPTRP